MKNHHQYQLSSHHHHHPNCCIGMKNNFLGLKSILEQHISDFRGNNVIIGDVYSPGTFAVWIAEVSGTLWMLGIALIIFGKSIFDITGLPVPFFVDYISNNKVKTFIILFVLNNIGHSFLVTGSFEIYLNDDLIFSKLQTGRLK